MHVLGGANVHIKGFGSTPIPLQGQISTEGIGGSLSLKYAGENTEITDVYIFVLVRDAASRLPNGEGTRLDVRVCLRMSDSDDNIN